MKNRVGKLISSVLLACGLAFPCLLAAQPVNENLLKAAFTYNFIMYTEWPAHAQHGKKEITLCVAAGSEMKKSLGALDGKAIQFRRLKVRVLAQQKMGLQHCHALYLDNQEAGNWAAYQKALTGKSILTISDSPHLARKGAMVLLARNGSRMVFDIDQKAVAESGLGLSSKLLRLARRVYR